jgi:mRNA-degrading endonuclease RelE of RelBE toxin-antitoxin system
MYTIEFTDDAKRQLRQFPARNQRALVSSIEEQLTHQPTEPTRNRKQLRPNQLAEWELRVQEFRVFYNVEETEYSVAVVAIAVKKGNKFIIEGKEYTL